MKEDSGKTKDLDVKREDWKENGENLEVNEKIHSQKRKYSRFKEIREELKRKDSEKKRR